MDVPAIAFSGAGGSKHVYTQADPVADVYAQVATKLVQAITGAGAPYLPPGIGLVSPFFGMKSGFKVLNQYCRT
jgi:hypothetical protein